VKRRNATKRTKRRKQQQLFRKDKKGHHRTSLDVEWETRPKQTSLLRMQALIKKKMEPAKNARYACGKVRNKNGQRFDGTGRKDKEYQATLKKIGRIRKEMKAGKLDHILKQNEEEINTKEKRAHNKTMGGKYVVPEAPGCNDLDHDIDTEKQLYEQLKEL